MIFFSSVTLTASPPHDGYLLAYQPDAGDQPLRHVAFHRRVPHRCGRAELDARGFEFPGRGFDPFPSDHSYTVRKNGDRGAFAVLPARKRESEPRKLVAGIHLRRQDLVPRRDLYILYLHGAEQFMHLLRSLDVQDRRIGIDRPTFDDRNSLPRVGKLDAAVVACRNELVQRGCLHFADRLLVDQVRSGVGANPWSGGRCGGGGEQQRQKNEAFHRTGMLYGG